MAQPDSSDGLASQFIAGPGVFLHLNGGPADNEELLRGGQVCSGKPARTVHLPHKVIPLSPILQGAGFRALNPKP